MAATPTKITIMPMMSRRVTVSPAMSTPFQVAGGDTGTSWRFKPTPGLIAVAVLLLGALGIYLFPATHSERSAEVTSEAAPSPLPVRRLCFQGARHCSIWPMTC